MGPEKQTAWKQVIILLVLVMMMICLVVRKHPVRKRYAQMLIIFVFVDQSTLVCFPEERLSS